MNSSLRFQPRVESLEDRLPPSAAPLPPVLPPGPAAGHIFPGLHRLPLNGQIIGNWAPMHSLPDTGLLQSLDGSGKVTPLSDDVHLTGQLTMPGFTLSGRATGEIKLSDAKGSVTIKLVGAMPQPGFSGPPTKFYYSIEGGTGKYAHAWGGGIVNFQEWPGGGIVPPPRAMGPMILPVAPHFTFTLHAYT
jgi:hypothetical protein